MPQYIVVQCGTCATFQVVQEPKSRKFACRLCGERNSVRRVYARSDKGRDVRPVCQRLNSKRGELHDGADGVRVREDMEMRAAQRGAALPGLPERARLRDSSPGHFGSASRRTEESRNYDGGEDDDDEEDGMHNLYAGAYDMANARMPVESCRSAPFCAQAVAEEAESPSADGGPPSASSSSRTTKAGFWSQFNRDENQQRQRPQPQPRSELHHERQPKQQAQGSELDLQEQRQQPVHRHQQPPSRLASDEGWPGQQTFSAGSEDASGRPKTRVDSTGTRQLGFWAQFDTNVSSSADSDTEDWVIMDGKRVAVVTSEPAEPTRRAKRQRGAHPFASRRSRTDSEDWTCASSDCQTPACARQ